VIQSTPVCNTVCSTAYFDRENIRGFRGIRTFALGQTLTPYRTFTKAYREGVLSGGGLSEENVLESDFEHVLRRNTTQPEYESKCA